MAGQIPPEVRERRAGALRELGRAKAHAFRERHVGRTVQALIQGRSGGRPGATHGLTGNYLAVLVSAAPAAIGSIRAVRVTRHEGGKLHGEICD
jgi:tRNA A37 methylthiotransferase MiaB